MSPKRGRPKVGYDWDEQLAVGHRGERFLQYNHPGIIPAPEGERRWDLMLAGAPRAQSIELKTDSHAPTATPNFFLERWTVVLGTGKRLPGGPWRTAAHGIDLFVYLFLPPVGKQWVPAAWWFTDVPALVAVLEELIALKRAAWRSVANQGVRAEGLLVRRDLLESLLSASCRRVEYGGGNG